MRTPVPLLLLALCSPGLAAPVPEWATSDLRAGIIGTDTSHVPAFTGLLHRHPEWRIRVVAAFKGGSPDLPASANRVEKFAKQLQDKHDVEIVESIDALLTKVDVVLLESVDGRPHLEQARPVLEAGKRVFIDKPFTATLEDAREIVRLSKQTGTPFFSCSCSRFMAEVQRIRRDPGVGQITKVQGSSPISFCKGHLDMAWYGIHGLEALYAVMGPGCVSVSREIDADRDITTSTWQDGRVGVFRGVKKGNYKPIAKVWGTAGEAETKGGFNYTGLVEVMAEFFHTGEMPIDPTETVEMFEFMAAAQLSKERGGAEVRLKEVRK